MTVSRTVAHVTCTALQNAYSTGLGLILHVTIVDVSMINCQERDRGGRNWRSLVGHVQTLNNIVGVSPL